MKLTVLQALPALDVGGVERGTIDVAEELVKRGHRSLVIAAGGAMLEELLDTGSEHFALPIGKKSLFTLQYVSRLRHIIYDNDVKILHARSRLPAWISYLAWRGIDATRRPRFITSVHGPYTVNPYSKIMTAGENIIAISNYIHDYILTNYPDTDPAKITVIPRGVNTKKYFYGFRPDDTWQRQWRQEHPQLQGKFLITLPARVTRWKGQEDFIEIIARLRATEPDIRGIIAGGAHPGKKSFFERLRAKASALGITDNITFTGQRADLREIISVSDIILSLAKKPEAFGRTTLEALCLGRPVVAYDHGGTSEVLQAIFPEGLIAPNDIVGAVKLIKQYRKDRPVVPDQNPFTLQRMLDNTIGLYEDVALIAQPKQSCPKE